MLGQNRRDEMVGTKWHEDKMVRGQNGTRTKWYEDKMVVDKMVADKMVNLVRGSL